MEGLCSPTRHGDAQRRADRKKAKAGDKQARFEQEVSRARRGS
jgi:hypothetical protein